MSLAPLTDRQKTLIVNNVVKACKNIDSLNKSGYKYISLCSGFIAHYSLYGFIGHYYDNANLKHDIISFAGQNQWKNFQPGDKDYAYYASKADVYNRILAQIM